jgi:cysteinyl-tRNA synthetase
MVSNTLGQAVQTFTPIAEGSVRLFVCGPTVYDLPHLGHAKTYTQFDFIARTLRWLGYDVFYLQNITDIDDKIIARAAERGISWRDLAQEFETSYHEDMRALHNCAVNKHARATDYIPQIVAQVESLLKSGHGYHTPDGVYYDLEMFPGYGRLSGRTNLGTDDAVSRIDEGVAKRNQGDFCLWKTAKPGEPSWDSSLGPGRPGWHIEDTAITEAELGQHYDLHGGAIDLIFPHHEAEIAQMEAIAGTGPLARYWLHTGFLNVGQEKMAKSKGNFFTIREALRIYDFRTLRFFFLRQHYRTTITFANDLLIQAKAGLARIDELLFRVSRDLDDGAIEPKLAALREDVVKAIKDDFHTPRAFASIFQFVNEANSDGYPLGRGVHRLFCELDSLFDCFGLSEIVGVADRLDGQAIEQLVRTREDFRRKRDFAAADAIRQDLLARGVQVYDSADGVRWRIL